MSVIKYAVVISILTGNCKGLQLKNAIPMKKGSNIQQCAGVVSGCQNGCGRRLEDQGTEYVQFKVYIINGAISCEKYLTEKGEMVSANPPTPDFQHVVFNVPCCQQRRFDVLTTKTTQDPKTSPTIVSPRNLLPSTKKIETKPVFATFPPSMLTPSTTAPDENPDKLSWNNMVLLITTVLCFLLLLIILTLMVCKIRKKKRGKSLRTDAEASPVTNATSNGAVLTGVTTSEKNKQNKSASEAVSNVVENIPPPPTYNNEEEKTHSQRGRKSSQDYVVLKTMATTPPKSARSNRTRELSNKSEEVMIVGRGNRPHGYQNSGIPNGHVGNFNPSGNLTDVIPASPTIQPQLPGRNLQHKNKLREEAFKQRSNSIPHASHDNSEDVENDIIKSKSLNHNATSATLEGKLSPDGMDPQLHKNIYNILREENIQDSDYQRLNREGKIQITNVKTSEEKNSKNNDAVFTGTPEDEEGIKEITTKDMEELKQTLKEHLIIGDEDDEGTERYGTYFQNSNTPSLSEEDKTGLTYEKHDIETSDYVDAPLLPKTKPSINGVDDSIVEEYTIERHTNPIFLSGNAKEELSTDGSKDSDGLLQESEEL